MVSPIPVFAVELSDLSTLSLVLKVRQLKSSTQTFACSTGDQLRDTSCLLVGVYGVGDQVWAP